MTKKTPNLKFKPGKILCTNCCGLGYIIYIGDPSIHVCNTCNGAGHVDGTIIEEELHENVKSPEKRD